MIGISKATPERGDTALVRPVRHEAKFVLPRRHAPAALECLRHFCAADPRFPVNGVNSLYFDTLRLDFLHGKEQSDYLKCKARLRWYTGSDGAPLSEFAWLEIKRKEGARSEKLRARIPVDAAALQARPLEAVRALDLGNRAETLFQADVRGLHPACVIRYTRHRFIDLLTGDRVALDDEIRSSDLNPDLFPLGRPCRVDYAVLEVKGPGGRALPADLRVLERFGLRRTSFSKYLECLITD